MACHERSVQGYSLARHYSAETARSRYMHLESYDHTEYGILHMFLVLRYIIFSMSLQEDAASLHTA
jgi:hypothetical protein